MTSSTERWRRKRERERLKREWLEFEADTITTNAALEKGGYLTKNDLRPEARRSAIERAWLDWCIAQIKLPTRGNGGPNGRVS